MSDETPVGVYIEELQERVHALEIKLDIGLKWIERLCREIDEIHGVNG